MTNTWETALAAYRYPVHLPCYRRASCHDNWFNCRIASDHTETMAFESRFRELAEKHIEAWYEVVFSEQLWRRCNEYVTSPTKESFRRFLKTDSEKLFGAHRCNLRSVCLSREIPDD